MRVYVSETHWYDDRYAAEKKKKIIYGMDITDNKEEKPDKDNEHSKNKEKETKE